MIYLVFMGEIIRAIADVAELIMTLSTVSDEICLVNMRDQGWSFRHIAKIMNRSESEVASKYLQLVPLSGCDDCKRLLFGLVDRAGFSTYIRKCHLATELEMMDRSILSSLVPICAFHFAWRFCVSIDGR
jgi:hypothetical protein